MQLLFLNFYGEFENGFEVNTVYSSRNKRQISHICVKCITVLFCHYRLLLTFSIVFYALCTSIGLLVLLVPFLVYSDLKFVSERLLHSVHKMSTLSEAELARIAANHEKAKNLRSSKLIHHPYATDHNNPASDCGPIKRYVFRKIFSVFFLLVI